MTFEACAEELLSGGSTANAVAAVLKRCLDGACQEDDLRPVLEVAAFVSAKDLTLELLGGNQDAVDRLCHMNLLRYSGFDQGNTYSIHHLHQDALRLDRSPTEAMRAVTSILTSIDCQDPKTFARGRAMLVHVDAVEQWKFNSKEEQLQFAEVLRVSGEILMRVDCRYAKAEKVNRTALEIVRTVHGDDHDAAFVAELLNGLATALERQVLFFVPFCSITAPRYGGFFDFQGKLDDAVPLYLQALAIDEKVYGKDHPEVATDMNNLAHLYEAQVRNFNTFYSITAPHYGEYFACLGKVRGS